MKRMLTIPLLVVALVLAGAASAKAGCRVEYKAKRNTPFALFYDTAVLSGPCATAEAQLRQMLATQGLVLLKILSARPQ